MTYNDITYCSRECANMECRRNVKALMGKQYTWKCVNVSMAEFTDCENWREKDERSR